MIIDQCAFFIFSLSQWSGKMALRFDKELGVNDKDKIFDGAKRICPQEVLNGFIALDKYTRSYLDKVGFRFRVSNLWGVNLQEVESTKAFLEGQEVKFHKLVDELRQNYDNACERFFQGKEYEDQLRESKKDIDDIISKFTFNHYHFQFDTGSPISNLEPGSLFSDFVHAVAKQANDVLKAWDAREETDKLKSQSIKALKELYDKIDSYSMLSPQLSRLAGYIQSVLNSFPAKRALKGPEVDQAYSILFILRDPAAISNYGKGLTGSTPVVENEDEPAKISSPEVSIALTPADEPDTEEVLPFLLFQDPEDDGDDLPAGIFLGQAPSLNYPGQQAAAPDSNNSISDDEAGDLFETHQMDDVTLEESRLEDAGAIIDMVALPEDGLFYCQAV